jgi:hypothetical protein
MATSLLGMTEGVTYRVQVQFLAMLPAQRSVPNSGPTGPTWTNAKRNQKIGDWNQKQVAILILLCGVSKIVYNSSQKIEV